MNTTENNSKDQTLIQEEKRQWLWFVYGALYGVFLRFFFGVVPSEVAGPMSVAFLIATPLVVGALTIYGYRGQDLRLSQLILYPWATIALLLLGSAISMMEGLICIVIMSPLFLLFSSLGGLLMAGCLHYLDENTKPLLSIAFLPYLVFFAEPNLELNNKNLQIVESVIVQASPETIWTEIMTAKEIKADELPLSFSHLIGVPKPLEGLNVEVSGQEVRYSIWEKGVNFKANVTDRTEHKYIKWDYVFDEQSFPKGSMDDHVAIGGTYFDLHDTAFTLSPISPNETELTITANYRVNSAINFYAIPVSKFLGVDFVKTILGLYKNRSEA